jgi:uncharacterized DUF497 family protein
MKVSEIIWLDQFVAKLRSKHHVETDEVEEILSNKPLFHFVEHGYRENENLYAALGQTDSGRYLIVLFIFKEKGRALVISARDMTAAERKRYEKKS